MAYSSLRTCTRVKCGDSGNPPLLSYLEISDATFTFHVFIRVKTVFSVRMFKIKIYYDMLLTASLALSL